jgi:hypothetical protein
MLGARRFIWTRPLPGDVSIDRHPHASARASVLADCAVCGVSAGAVCLATRRNRDDGIHP